MYIMIDIYYEIYRLQVCAWTYNWNNKELENKIRSRIIDYQLNNYFKRKGDEKQSLDDLILDTKNRECFNISLIKEEKSKSYGNKYVKRKFRW